MVPEILPVRKVRPFIVTAISNLEGKHGSFLGPTPLHSVPGGDTSSGECVKVLKGTKTAMAAAITKLGTDLGPYLFPWRRIWALLRHQRTIMGPPL